MPKPKTSAVLASMRAALHMTKQRCYNPRCRDYPSYGGRGITICSRWLGSFKCFVADMGLRPPGMTLERRDNDGPYSPSNCVWADRKTQAANRRVSLSLTHQGETLALPAWAERTGIPYGTLKARVTRLGYTASEALSKPVKPGQKAAGKIYTARQRPDMSNVPRGLDSPRTKLSVKQVLRMRKLASKGLSYSELARRNGVSVTTASNAVQGLGAYKDLP